MMYKADNSKDKYYGLNKGIYMYRPKMLPWTPFVGDDWQSEIRTKGQKKNDFYDYILFHSS